MAGSPIRTMRQTHTELVVATRGRGLYEITPAIRDKLGVSGLTDGLLTLQILHTSASLLIQENADPDVRVDLDAFFARLVPDGDRLFCHTLEGEDDMAAHVRTALTSVCLSLPFRGGRVTLGTWQGIYLWEHRTIPHRRRVAVHLIGD